MDIVDRNIKVDKVLVKIEWEAKGRNPRQLTRYYWNLFVIHD